MNKSANDYYIKGNEFFTTRSYSKAIDSFNKCIEKDSSFINAYFQRGLSYLLLDEISETYTYEALEDFSTVTNLDSNNSTAYINKGIVFQILENFKQAVIEFSEAIRIDSENLLAYIKRGDSYYALYEFENSINDFTIAINLLKQPKEFKSIEDSAIELTNYFISIMNNQDPFSITSVYKSRAKCYFKLKDYNNAISDYSFAISTNANSDLFNNRGYVYYLNNEYDKAIKDFDKALELDPSNKKSIGNKKLAEQAMMAENVVGEKKLDTYMAEFVELIRYRKNDEIIHLVKECINIYPEASMPYVFRAVALLEIGEKESGIRDLKRALSIDPENEPARHLLNKNS